MGVPETADGANAARLAGLMNEHPSHRPSSEAATNDGSRPIVAKSLGA